MAMNIRVSILLAAAALLCAPAFAASLSWTPPTKNVDGSDLTDLAGYKIQYAPLGTPMENGEAVDVADPATTSHEIEGVEANAHWWTIRAYDTSGNHSPFFIQTEWPYPDGGPESVETFEVDN